MARSSDIVGRSEPTDDAVGTVVEQPTATGNEIAAPAAASEAVFEGSPDSLIVEKGRLKYIPAFDGIRGIALVAVIASHDNYLWAKGAFLGVDTFFMLSGFLITALLLLEVGRNGGVGYAQFWARRARRLLPGLLLVLVFVALYNHFGVVPWLRASVRNDMLASLFYFANWRFIADKQSYFELFSAASPLRHMWSLAIEEQYYLFWPIIVGACLRVARGSTRVLGAVCALGIVASVIAMWTRYSPGNPSFAYYATDARAQFIFFGALLGIVCMKWRPAASTQQLFAVAAIPAFLIMLVAYSRTSPTAPGYYHAGSVAFALVALVVMVGALSPGPVTWVLALVPLAWLGRVSYSVYLWHWPIDVWITPDRVHMTPFHTNLLRLVVTFALALASYYLVERPIRLKKWSPRVTAAVFVPAVAVVMAMILASTSGAAPGAEFHLGHGRPSVLR